jgi:hypothetical protein
VNVGSDGNTRQVRHVRLGDHLCLPFASDDEQREVLTAYITDGLDRGERVLYLADQTQPEAIGRWLSIRGVDSASAMERGQLQIRNVSSEPFVADKFDPDIVITLIRFEVREARQAGGDVFAQPLGQRALILTAARRKRRHGDPQARPAYSRPRVLTNDPFSRQWGG